MSRIFLPLLALLTLGLSAAAVGGCRGGDEGQLIDGHVSVPVPAPR